MPDDESLLQEVLRFISMALRLSGEVTDGTLQALGEVLYQPSGPLIGLSHRTSVRGETRDVPENVNIKRWDIVLNRIFLQGMYLVLRMICRCSFNFENVPDFYVNILQRNSRYSSVLKLVMYGDCVCLPFSVELWTKNCFLLSPPTTVNFPMSSVEGMMSVNYWFL